MPKYQAYVTTTTGAVGGWSDVIEMGRMYDREVIQTKLDIVEQLEARAAVQVGDTLYAPGVVVAVAFSKRGHAPVVVGRD